MKPRHLFLLLLLLTANGFHYASAQIVLKNTCNGSTEPVLYTDAVNYFRIENWPGKALMKLECSNCTVEFQNSGGIFSLTPSDNLLDTLNVFKDEKLYQQFVLSHKSISKPEVHLSGGSNKTISRKHFTPEAELIIKSGKPGCRTIYTVEEYDIVFAGEKIHCTGNHLSAQVAAKLSALKSGMQFNIENATYLLGKEVVNLPVTTYFLKD